MFDRRAFAFATLRRALSLPLYVAGTCALALAHALEVPRGR